MDEDTDDGQSLNSRSPGSLNRRQLLQRLGIAGAALAFSSSRLLEAIAREQGVPEPPDQRPSGDIPRRPLGKTGVEVSAICFGGAHFGKIPDDTQAIRLLQEAIDSGMTFLEMPGSITADGRKN